MASSKFNIKKFKQLLKKGIGSRTQKEFANATGIAEATINRMLNKEDISCPREKTLEILASHMKTVTLGELMSACGYEVDTIENRVARVESDIEDYFEFSNTKIYTSKSEMMKGMGTFLSNHNVKIVEDDTKENEEIPREYEKEGAEEVMHLGIGWQYDTYVCKTYIKVYYAETKAGKIIFVGTDIGDVWEEKGSYIHHTMVQTREQAASVNRLLASIFGVDNKKIPVTYTGYGFDLTTMPKGFMAFLHNHADTFCDTKENIAMYQELTMNEKDAESLLESYASSSGWGYGAVIASIMTKESDHEFNYYYDGFDVEGNAHRCVMEKYDYLDIGVGAENIDAKLLIYIYECAKELEVEEFGLIYHMEYIGLDKKKLHKTKDFYYTI